MGIGAKSIRSCASNIPEKKIDKQSTLDLSRHISPEPKEKLRSPAVISELSPRIPEPEIFYH